MKTWQGLIAAAALGALSLGGASPASAQQNIAIFTGTSPIFGPVFVADAKGYFKEEGINVTVKAFTSGADASEGFRSGGAQFLVASDVPLIYQLVGGDAVLLGQFSQNDDMLVMMGNKAVQSPTELKGKKIGLVRKSGSEYMLKRYLEKANLSLNDVEMVNIPPFEQIPAMVNGDVAAVSTWKPFNLKLMGVSKDFKILTENGPVGYYLYSGILTKRALATPENKKLMVGVMRALHKGAAWLDKASEKEKFDLIAAQVKTSPGDVREVIKNNKWSMAVDDNFKSAITNIASYMHEQGLIKKELDWNASTDFSYLREVDPSLVKK
jgi:NitT/TauT family transport system substrate-binding protein